MPRRMLFPLRRCPGLVPLPEIDRDVVIVVVDRPAERTRPTLVGYVDASALHAEPIEGAGTSGA